MSGNNNTNLSDLKPFFEAKSVAVLGASLDVRKPNGRPAQYLLERGYRGAIYPVNPKYESIGALKCYPSVLDIPGEVDLVIVGVAASDTLPLLEQCVKKNVKGAVILSSGFGEVGGEGQRMEEEITALARRSGMRIMGPNCIGMINNLNNLWASFALLPTGHDFCYSKRFSLISQSGFFGAYLFEMAGTLKIDFDYFASVGNQADLSFTDFFDYMVEDHKSSIIVGYIEGLKDGRGFMDAARRAWRAKKPVIVMKVGRTGAGARAVSSHTGSLAGSDRIYSAAFRQTGVIRANGLEQLLTVLTMAAGTRMPQGNRVAILSASGGGAVIISDQCVSQGLEVAELLPETRQALDEVLPAFASSANPIDFTAQLLSQADMLFYCFKVVHDDPNVDMLIVNFNLLYEVAKNFAVQLVELYGKINKPPSPL